MKIAIISLDQIWEDKETNKRNCASYIDMASKNACDLIIFPEMTLTGFTMASGTFCENISDSPTIEFFKKQSENQKIDIIAGMILKENSSIYNCSVLFQFNPDQISIYKKIHPFSYSGENNYYTNGTELVKSWIKEFDFGFTVCYDLRFPELFQALSKDVACIVNIANWPEKRADHWNALLKARAIENQIYMIGVNRTGLDGNGHNYIKSSVVYDADGKQLLPDFAQQLMDVYTLNSLSVQEKRNSFPVKRDRQTELYKKIL
jgi:omega-amidase